MDDSTRQEIEAVIRSFLQNKYADGAGVVPPIAAPPPGQDNNPPLTRPDVEAIVTQMLQSSASAGDMTDAMTGSESVGEQVRIPFPQQTQQFDKTDAQLALTIRRKFTSSGGWEICIPGSSGSTPEIAFQNGVVIPIGSGELTIVDSGPWYTINTVASGATSIYMSATPSGSPPGDWPVNPTTANSIALRFSASTPNALAIKHGIAWLLASSDGTIPHQLTTGVQNQTAFIGDTDCAPVLSPTSKSIIQKLTNVFSINNWDMSPLSNDGGLAPMLVNDLGVAKLMAQPAGVEGDANLVSPPSYSVIRNIAAPAYLSIYNIASASVLSQSGDHICTRRSVAGVPTIIFADDVQKAVYSDSTGSIDSDHIHWIDPRPWEGLYWKTGETDRGGTTSTHGDLIQDNLHKYAFDITNRTAYETTGANVTANFSSRQLLKNASDVIVDWSAFTLANVVSAVRHIIVDWGGYTLAAMCSGTLRTIVDWGNQRLYDAAGLLRLDWTTGELSSTSSGTSKVSVDFQSFKCYDFSHAESVDWTQHYLKDGVQTVNWQENICQLSKNVASTPVVTVDWLQSQLRNGATTVADWGGGAGYMNAGTGFSCGGTGPAIAGTYATGLGPLGNAGNITIKGGIVTAITAAT